MSTAQCSVDECTKAVTARAMCNSHYRKLLKYGTPTHTQPRIADMTCDAHGCDKPRSKREWCGTHYLRMYKHGDANYQRTTYNECTIDGCARTPRTRTSPHCEVHYYRMRRTGSITLTSTRTASPSYRAAHSRIARDQGHAREHPCVDCSAPAQHWSYTHTDPDERMSRGGQPYSVDQQHYEPRCPPCHAIFDGTGRNQYSA